MNANQLSRYEEYVEIAKEVITIEAIGGAEYVFGSELATLRLFKKMPDQKQGFSVNRNTFYFCVEKPPV